MNVIVKTGKGIDAFAVDVVDMPTIQRLVGFDSAELAPFMAWVPGDVDVFVGEGAARRALSVDPRAAVQSVVTRMPDGKFFYGPVLFVGRVPGFIGGVWSGLSPADLQEIAGRFVGMAE